MTFERWLVEWAERNGKIAQNCLRSASDGLDRGEGHSGAGNALNRTLDAKKGHLTLWAEAHLRAHNPERTKR